ncbi:hypothetical protein GCM10010467_23340 [Actinocorallia glomerata]|uniref:Secreted protein n=2 Tax=Actinomycetes TaxID=1760 RepID=A0ABP6LT09_9MICC
MPCLVVLVPPLALPLRGLLELLEFGDDTHGVTSRPAWRRCSAARSLLCDWDSMAASSTLWEIAFQVRSVNGK